MTGQQSGMERIPTLAARVALEPSILPELLAQIGKQMGAAMVTLESYSALDGRLESMITDRPDILCETRDEFEQHYATTNPRMNISHGQPVGSVLSDDLIGDDRCLMQHEFYADFLSPSDLRYYLGAFIIRNDRRKVLLSVQRSPNAGRFDRAHKDRFQAILPDLANACDIGLRQPALADTHSLDQVTDNLPMPILLLFADGRLDYANRAAARLFHSAILKTGMDGQLASRDPALDNAITEVVACLARGSKTTLRAGRCRSGPFAIRGFAISRDQSNGSDRQKDLQLCLVFDGAATAPLPLTRETREQLGLTSREAEIAGCLATGLSIDDIAIRLDISRNTVRTHCSMLREKLGVPTSLAAAAQLRAIQAVEFGS